MKTETLSRDMRLDALRGLFLVIMAGVHAPTPVSHLLQEPFGYTSAAEGFIFLGACLSGMVYGRTYGKSDWRTMSRRVWTRARLIYVIHLAILLPVALLAWMLGSQVAPLANHFHDFLEHPGGSLALLPFLLHQPPLFDILPLYVIFLGVTPFLLAIARRRGWKIILMSSALIWLAAQFKLDARLIGDPSRWLPLRWGAFDFLAWQLVWVAGLALGETVVRRPVIATKHRTGLAAVAAIIVLAGLLARHGILPETWVPSQIDQWVDKWTLGPLRVLNFGAWVLLLMAWNPKPPVWLLSPTALLGRHSLAVFAFHLPLVIAATTFIGIFSYPVAVQTDIGLLVIVLLFPWATWLEHHHRPPVPVAGMEPALLGRLSLRASSRSMESPPEIPLRPLFPRVRASARIVHV
jgi:hypothetical protein